MAFTDWQHPFVNIFKHVRVEEWKRSAKEGDVSTYTDKMIKCSVFRIKGPVPANSYILIPKNSNHSLGLTGRYFYLLFRPTPGKLFVVHLDVVAEENRVVRISFSNMFKEFKSTATWLQFPFLCGSAKDSVHESTSKTARHGFVGTSPTSARWTCLMLDLQHSLSVYLNRSYCHLKTVKLCANMAVKNVFTSDLQLDPGVSFSEAKRKGLAYAEGTGPMPREMSFPVPKGCSWHDRYDHIKLLSDVEKSLRDSFQRSSSSNSDTGQKRSVTAPSQCVDLSRADQDRMCLVQQIPTPHVLRETQRAVVTNLPELGVVSSQDSDDWLPDVQQQQLQQQLQQRESNLLGPHQLLSESSCFSEDGGVHVFVRTDDKFSKSGEESEEEFVCSSALPLSSGTPNKQQKLLPDPILNLNRIIGFGGATTKCALWTKSGDAVVYPSHAIVVSMKISTKEQRFFIGHTDKVSALAFNGNTTLLASAQTGHHSVVRVWNYHRGNCLAMFRIHAHSLSSLSISTSVPDRASNTSSPASRADPEDEIDGGLTSSFFDSIKTAVLHLLNGVIIKYQRDYCNGRPDRPSQPETAPDSAPGGSFLPSTSRQRSLNCCRDSAACAEIEESDCENH